MANGNECYLNLMAAIIQNAVEDICCPKTSVSQKDKVSAEKFMNSDYCTYMLSELGIEMPGSEFLKKAKEVSA